MLCSHEKAKYKKRIDEAKKEYKQDLEQYKKKYFESNPNNFDQKGMCKTGMRDLSRQKIASWSDPE